jgi:hypothetical protein
MMDTHVPKPSLTHYHYHHPKTITIQQLVQKNVTLNIYVVPKEVVIVTFGIIIIIQIVFTWNTYVMDLMGNGFMITVLHHRGIIKIQQQHDM